MPALDLYDRADFYDAFHGTYAADRAYYVKMAKRVGGPVLDVA
ncbi:MAG: SAM-dependent methyltransferase, partial [Verrucomicrobiae bacterium]|nr:SAM-dependent methyltransferase [Verrucomicrobiae bacterium]